MSTATASTIKYYPHQEDILARNPARRLLAHSTGTGKTITAISLANQNCTSALIVVPKALFEQWGRELEKHAKPDLNWKVITKEQFKARWKDLPYFDGVIIDEGHYFAGIKSQLSRSMYAYLKRHNTPYRWIATATPYLSTPFNIYTLAKLLGFQWNYYEFMNEFFIMIKMGARTIPKIRDDIEEKLADRVREIADVVDMAEVVEVPEQTFETVYFDKTEEQIDAISKLDEPIFISRWTKTHQIENGFLYGDPYTPTQSFMNPKDFHIIREISLNSKVAIFVRYTEQITHLKKILSETFIGMPIFELHGGIKDRDAMVQAAEAAETGVIIIQAACSAGYELPSFDTILFASLSFSYVDYQQGIGRFLRINKLKKNRYVHLVTHGVDEDVFKSINNKQDFSLAIYEKK